MKFFVISDNRDTQMGMRLAGMEGVVVHTPEEVSEALDKAVADPEIGVVLMTQKLIDICAGKVYDIKLNYRRPLIVEEPDRHGYGNVGDSIERYVSEAIGIKF